MCAYVVGNLAVRREGATSVGIQLFLCGNWLYRSRKRERERESGMGKEGEREREREQRYSAGSF